MNAMAHVYTVPSLVPGSHIYARRRAAGTSQAETKIERKLKFTSEIDVFDANLKQNSLEYKN